ncbi:MAG: PAS domain-containing protein [Acidobacteria bacterium]|nr:PAS domain-containing protein [Acidobacteriota bacterium]
MVTNEVAVWPVGSAALAESARTAGELACARVVAGPGEGAVALLGCETGAGPARVAELLAAGAVAVIGVAPAADVASRAAFFENGAADVVDEGVAPAELAQRLRLAARRAALAQRARAQDRELVLATSLARRLVRGAESLPATIREALEGLGRALGLAEAEVRVLRSPWRAEATSELTVTWTPTGTQVLDGQPLEAADLDALRGRRPVALGERGAVLPLMSRERGVAVLRVTAREARPLGEETLRLLYGAGSILAGAIESADRVAGLRGHSRELEALLAERAREAEEQRALFQAVIDAMPVSLHAIDRAFRVVVWNRGREDGPLGRPRGEVLGRSLFTVTGEDAELRREYEEVFATGRPRVTEVERAGPGPQRLFRVEKVPMRLGPGADVTHVITFARDVTEQRSIERTMAQTEKMAAVGRLAAGIAHEIRNPLATIASCAEAMRGRLCEELDDAARGEVRGDAELVIEEAYRCKEILDGLLDFSRAAPDRRELCELEAVARRALRLLHHNPRVRGVRLELRCEPGVPPTSANADQLVQVLLALVLNAADAASGGGNVAVHARRGPAGEAVLSVEDDGPGIPAELRERVFEPFFTTKPPGQGTGLGLAVAYGIVQAHGGRLELMSHPGLGARFDVILPAAAEVPAATGEPR